jgi:hypothetical protein
VTNITSGSIAFQVTATRAASSFRISGMTLNSPGPFTVWVKSDAATTPVKGWRIDHITFPQGYENVFVQGMSWGLVDNCTFTFAAGGSDGIIVYGVTGADSGIKGDGGTSWDWPLNLGTDEAVYVEDCTFNAPNNGQAINDLSYGARMVFRHNTVNGGFFQAHSTRANQRGGMKCGQEPALFSTTQFLDIVQTISFLIFSVFTGLLVIHTMETLFTVMQMDHSIMDVVLTTDRTLGMGISRRPAGPVSTNQVADPEHGRGTHTLGRACLSTDGRTEPLRPVHQAELVIMPAISSLIQRVRSLRISSQPLIPTAKWIS